MKKYLFCHPGSPISLSTRFETFPLDSGSALRFAQNRKKYDYFSSW